MADVTDDKGIHRKEQRIFTPHAFIGIWELLLYATFFAISLSYGNFNIAQVSTVIREEHESSFLDKGQFLTSRKDVADHEWRAFESVFKTYIPCLLINAAATWILGCTSSLHLRRWFTLAIGLSTLAIITGLYNTRIILTYATVAYIGMLLHPLAFSWLMGFYMIYQPCEFQKGSDSLFPQITNVFARSYSFWHLSWNIMRFVSFGSEWYWHRRRQRLQQQQEDKKSNAIAGFSFVDFLCFCFYTPTLFGPIISYPDFYKQVIYSNNKEKPSQFSMQTFLTKLAIVSAWAFGLVLATEVFYLHIIAQDLNLVKRMNGWGAAAFTWAHGQYFQAKYMVVYGLPWLAAFLDGGVRLLPMPVFISRVYLYSEMWKLFDTGLYDFMKRYIYVPLGGSGNFLLATTGVFTFIFAWHGLTKHIAIWSAVNFVQVVAEKYLLSRSADPTSFLVCSIRNKLSPMAWRRLTALACAISFQMSVAVISIFVIGEEVGAFISYWTIVNLNINYFMYLLVSYSWVQTVFSWENWNAGHPF